MKTILEKNKEIISLIISKCNSNEWKNCQFYSVFYSIFKRSILLFPKESQGIELFDRENDYKSNGESYKKVIFDAYIPLVEFVNLFRYLEKNNLISFIPYYGNEFIDHELDNFKIIHSGINEVVENNNKIKNEELQKERFSILDTSVCEFLNEKYSCLISISPELYDLFQNDFKTVEQRRFEEEMSLTKSNHKKAISKANRQICLAWAAFTIALISLIVTTFSNNRSVIDVKSDPIELQLDEIINKMTLPDTINTKVTNDSLKVIIYKPKKVK